MLRHLRSSLALALLGALVIVPAALAQGGTGGGGGGTGGGGGGGGGGTGGGGGSTVKYAAINNASGVAECDGGSSMSIGLSKGTNNQIQGTINWAGGTNADGTSTLYGSWSVLLHDDTTGASLGGVIGETFGPTVSSALEKLLFGGVQAGSHDLTLTALKRPYSPSPDPTAPVTETCTTHFSVLAR